MKRVLDVCCGGKMFWFDRANENAVFMDKRSESFELPDASSEGGIRSFVITPDFQGDFTKLPFPDETFPLIVFDPPHLIGNGENGWLAKKYGKLERKWKWDIADGFRECFRVLKRDGVLIFKWNENDIPLMDVLQLTDVPPLFGNQYGKNFNSHWLVFMKPLPQKREHSDMFSLATA